MVPYMVFLWIAFILFWVLTGGGWWYMKNRGIAQPKIKMTLGVFPYVYFLAFFSLFNILLKFGWIY